LQYETIKHVGCKMADIRIGKLFTSKSLTDDEAFGLVLRKKNGSTRELTDRHFDGKGSQPVTRFSTR